MKFNLAVALLAAAVASAKSTSPSDRANDLINKMTLEEKIVFLGGDGMGNYPEDGRYVGEIPALDRLNIPKLAYNDGPQGFRDDKNGGTSTAFPSGVTLAATFDKEMAKLWGSSMGKEFFDKGANCILGPAMNVARVPNNGRNFEYMSGEDPYLGSKLVPEVITALQANKIIANAKHYVNNNQETNRTTMSANVDERTRFEMYYPPFQASIDAEVGSFMCSYNKINHAWSCENPEVLNLDLRERMGFEGYVMSDWGATHSPSLLEGLDQEMPASDFMNYDNLSPMDVEAIDQAVHRILTPYISVGAFDLSDGEKASVSIFNNVTSAEHFEAARTIAGASHVLLKNEDNILPFDFASKKVAVFGTQAESPCVGGGGSGQVTPAWLPTPLLTVHARVGGSEYGTMTDDVTYAGDDKSVEEMQDLAKDADLCLFFVGTSSAEGSDRETLQLTNDGYIPSVAAKCARSVGVVTTPGAVLTPWADDVEGLIIHFMPGVASAFATMDVLVGDVNPSGKLPITMPIIENQEGFTTKQFPGVDNKGNVTYSETNAFGYRFYHLHNESPRYWFGEGLTYSQMNLSKPTWSASNPNQISVTLSNTGKVDGAEIPQLYLQPPADCDQAVWNLRGFEKTFVKAGEAKVVTFELEDVDLSTWSVAGEASEHKWKKREGEYVARIGFSSNFESDTFVDVKNTI